MAKAKPKNASSITPAVAAAANMAKPKDTSAKYPVRIKIIFLLGIISVVVYANTLKNGFVYDDPSVITANSIVKKGVSAIPEILATPYRKGVFQNTTNDLYRPLSLVMFATEYQVFGDNPALFHLTNILLFAGCVILLFLFLDRLFDKKNTVAAFLASLLFALHPIHTEVVANIKSRDELLCFIFSFLCVNVFIRYIKGGSIVALFGGAACFFLAFLAKETVITFLAVIPLVFFFYQNENKRRAVFVTLSAVLVTIVCLAIRFFVLSAHNANNITDIPFIDNALASREISIATRIATAILILGQYLKLLFVPYPLICDYSYNSIPFRQFSDPLVLISLAVYLFLAVFGIRRLLKNKTDPYAFAILFFLITISLFSNIPFLIGTNLGERLLFFPSVGFCVAAGFLLEKWISVPGVQSLSFLKNIKLLCVLVPVVAIYGFITVQRNAEWTDSYTLFTTDAAKAPYASKLNFSAGLTAELNSDFENDTAAKMQLVRESIIYLRRSVAVYPDNKEAQIIMGWACYLGKQFDSAEAHEKKALELAPYNKTALNNMANIYAVRDKHALAADIYKRIISLDLAYPGAQSGLGKAYLGLGQTDSAEVHIVMAIQQDPKDAKAINNLVGVYFATKNYGKAIEYSKKAIELNPGYIDPYMNVAGGYFNLSKADSGILYLHKVIAIDPGYSRAYEMLATVYFSAGKQDSADRYEVLARKNDPGFKLPGR